MSSEERNLAAVHSATTAATQRLLAATIGLSDEQWREPSRLPGWTRGHLGTHLARNADALRRVVEGELAGSPQPMYGSEEERDAEIEAGAGRPGMDLQVDLDSSAGRLAEALDRVADDQWDRQVAMRGGATVALSVLPLARLNEVVLHHVDLGVGAEPADLDEQTIGLLLRWNTAKLTGSGAPGVLLEPAGAERLTLGRPGADAPVVSGPASAVLGWLTGRLDASAVSGAEGIELPPL